MNLRLWIERYVLNTTKAIFAKYADYQNAFQQIRMLTLILFVNHNKHKNYVDFTGRFL